MSESPAADLGRPFPTDQAVLFGGETASGLPLDDTWLFTGDPPGYGAAATAFGNWSRDPSAPPPTAALGEALAPDFTDSILVGFGGLGGPSYTAQGTTWGYFHPLAFLTTSATELNVGTSLNLTVFASGGQPPYTFAWSNLPSGCVVATTSVACVPTAFGIYNVSAVVTDRMGRTAGANVSVQVDPAGSSLQILSEFSGYFY